MCPVSKTWVLASPLGPLTFRARVTDQAWHPSCGESWLSHDLHATTASVGTSETLISLNPPRSWDHSTCNYTMKSHCLVYMVLEIEPRTLCMLTKHSANWTPQTPDLSQNGMWFVILVWLCCTIYLYPNHKTWDVCTLDIVFRASLIFLANLWVLVLYCHIFWYLK